MPEDAEPTPAPKPGRSGLLTIAAVVVIVVLAFGAAFVALPQGSVFDDAVTPVPLALLGTPNGDSFDIVATRLDGTIEPVPVHGDAQVRGVPTTEAMATRNTPLGSRLPTMRDGRVAYAIDVDGEHVLVAIDTSKGTTETLLEVGTTAIFAYDPASDALLARDSNGVCWRVLPGEEPEQFRGADRCSFLVGGAILQARYDQDMSTTEYTYSPPEGDVVEYAAGIEGFFEAGEYLVTSDLDGDDAMKVVVRETATGEVISTGDSASYVVPLDVNASGQVVALESIDDDERLVLIDGGGVTTIAPDLEVYDATIADDGTVLVPTSEALLRWSDGELIELLVADDLDVEIIDHGPDVAPVVFAWTPDGRVYGGPTSEDTLPKLGVLEGENVVVYSQPATAMLLFQQYLPDEDTFVVYSVFADGRFTAMLGAYDPSLQDVTDDGSHAFFLSAPLGSGGAYSVWAVPTVDDGTAEPVKLFDLKGGVIGNAQWDEVSRRFTFTLYADFDRTDPSVWAVALDGSAPELVWEDRAVLDHSHMWEHTYVIRGEPPFGPGSTWLPPYAEEEIEAEPTYTPEEEEALASGRGYIVEGEVFIPPLIPREEQLTVHDLVAVRLRADTGDWFVMQHSTFVAEGAGFSQGCGGSANTIWQDPRDGAGLVVQIKTRPAVCDWAYDPSIDTSAGPVVDCWKATECKVHIGNTTLTVAVDEQAQDELEAIVAALEVTDWATLDAMKPQKAGG